MSDKLKHAKTEKDYFNGFKKVIPVLNIGRKYFCLQEKMIWVQPGVSYLENKFHNMIKNANRYPLANRNEPSRGQLTEELECEMEEYIETAKLAIETLNYKFFTPLLSSQPKKIAQKDNLLYLNYKNKLATGELNTEGFVLLKGSVLSDTVQKSCPLHIHHLREKHKDKIDNNILMANILFNSPSAAACFVNGCSMNGQTAWKTKQNEPLKQIN